MPSNKLNAILDLWRQGKDRGEIADIVKLTPHQVSGMITRARENGDKRAIRRISGNQKSLVKWKDNARLGVQMNKRNNIARKFPISRQELQRIAASSNHPLTKLPVGWHAGHWPKALFYG